jgi:hypothetical protein
MTHDDYTKEDFDIDIQFFTQFGIDEREMEDFIRWVIKRKPDRELQEYLDQGEWK